MSRKIIRRRVVRERTGYSDTQRWRMEKKGTFPARVQLSETAVGWYEDEIDEWIRNRVRGAGRSMHSVLAARQAKRAASAAEAEAKALIEGETQTLDPVHLRGGE
jgi:prophage regulatory protein